MLIAAKHRGYYLLTLITVNAPAQVIPLLIAAGEDPESIDGYKHSVWDVACASYWNLPALATALGKDVKVSPCMSLAAATSATAGGGGAGRRWAAADDTGGWLPGPAKGFEVPGDDDHCDVRNLSRAGPALVASFVRSLQFV